jgi:hypothetical protein
MDVDNLISKLFIILKEEFGVLGFTTATSYRLWKELKCLIRKLLI